jgi:hypothetical protein
MCKVIDLKAYRAGKKLTNDLDILLDTKEAETIGLFFEEIVKKNKENEERLKKERFQNNKTVLKSYNIK